MTFRIEVWGDYACFTRPEFSAERVSYDVITPSAARGILESIYWHPGLVYHIDKIFVLNPIRFTNIRRNEISEVIKCSSALSALKNGTYFAEHCNEVRQQRASMILKNVHYVIEAHFSMSEKAMPGDNMKKFQDIILRRIRRGQYYSQPYFGCREFPAHFQEWEGEDVPALRATKRLGRMLYDLDFRNPENITPWFFYASMDKGVIDLSDCGVYRR